MVNDAVGGFLSYLNLQKRFSPLTVQNYEYDLNQFFTFLNDEVAGYTLDAISYQYIRSFIASLMNQGLSARSVNRKLSSLKSFFKYLVKNGKIADNPAQKVHGPKAEKKLPVF